MQIWQYCLLVIADHSTCFGRFLRPSSGVLKTVVAATGRDDVYSVRTSKVGCLLATDLGRYHSF